MYFNLFSIASYFLIEILFCSYTDGGVMLFASFLQGMRESLVGLHTHIVGDDFHCWSHLNGKHPP